MSRKKQAEKIKEDVIQWSKKVLEPMNKHIGFPACPFAAKWRKEGKFQEKIDFYNNLYNKKDVYFMGFHPSSPATVEDQAFLVDPTEETIEHSDLEYSMMLVQKFKQLYEASCKLHKIGYYEKWPKEYYEDVVLTRQNLYTKLFKKE